MPDLNHIANNISVCEFNPAPSLCHYRARYCDPATGHFISEDPSAFAGGVVNFYGYVRNSVGNLIDPFGLRPGDKYPSARCAGFNAVNDYNSTSIAQNKEYGGFIYQNSDGTFSYTDPHINRNAGIGNDVGLPRFWAIPIPGGTKTAGWYHTHAAFNPLFNGPGNPPPGAPGYNPNKDRNNDFEPQDMDISDLAPPRGLNGLPGILGTPQGQIKLYIPSGPKNPESGVTVPLNAKNCGCNQ